MAPAAKTTLTLNVNGETLDLTNPQGVMWQYEGWRQRIARQRTATVGGVGVYTDVPESFTVNVRGATQADVYKTLAKLIRMLANADQQRLALDPDYATLTVQLQGSENAPWECVVVGVPTDLDQLLELPDNFNRMLHVREVAGVRFSVLRRGTALSPTVDTTSDAGTGVMQAIFSNPALIASPAIGKLSLHWTGLMDEFPGGRLLVAATPAALSITDAVMLVSGNSSLVNDPTTNPRGGTIVRMTTSGGVGVSTAPVGVLPGRTLQLHVCVRPSNQSVAWRARAVLVGPTGGYYGQWEAVPTSTIPHVMSLAPILVPRDAQQVMIQFQTVTPVPGTIDVNYLAQHILDTATSRSIAISPLDLVLPDGTTALTYRTPDWMHERLALYVETGSPAQVVANAAYDGAVDLVTIGSTSCALWLATGGAGSEFWQQSDANGDVMTTAWVVDRQQAALFME